MPCDLAILLLSIYPKEFKTGYQRDICTPMFIAALFTIAKKQKQPKFQLAVKCIKKIWCRHTMECYAALKKEGNAVTCYNRGESCGHWTKWNKPVT